ncbi:MAG: sterol desaturase family protein [Fimbriimonadaceae bacterium]|nr:sterol desaturase family protein [Alphaproteobacteria bacterium]
MTILPQYAWFIGFWSFLFLLGFLESRYSDRETISRRATRWPVNIGLGVTNGVLISLLPATIVWVPFWADTNNLGLFNVIEAPLWFVIGATMLIKSLGQYVFHRLIHLIPALWLIHRVHHSDTYVDGSTGLRFHPLELIANIVFIAVLVMTMGLNAMALAVFEIVEILIGIATHTSLKLPQAGEKYLRILFITPGLHRLHHSDSMSESETNFGTVFSFWDRLFGTFLADPVRDMSDYRLGTQGVTTDEASSFRWVLISPLQGLWSKRRRDVGSP